MFKFKTIIASLSPKLIEMSAKKVKLDSAKARLLVRRDKSNDVGSVSPPSPPPPSFDSISTAGQHVHYLQSPVKSESDKKTYTVIHLPNGLIATLISDMTNVGEADVKAAEEGDLDNSISETESDDGSTSSTGSESEGDTEERVEKLAACALTVHAGSFSDPEEVQGLAHFLEHMIFMGSKKYPQENAFDAFIKRTGGSDNASTDCEHTTYHFECQELYLRKALDMFAQLFIDPLMKKEAMTREREAIESEFQMAVSSDEYRRQQLICTTVDPANPARLFTWGNKITLRDRVADQQLSEAVHRFRDVHYSSDRMKLAIQARLPTETLQRWVVDSFSGVKRLPLAPRPYSCLENPFDDEKFCQLYYVHSVRDLNTVDINWALPPSTHLYKTKPLQYLSFLIGHEGKGGIISELRRHNLALGLSAGNGQDGLAVNSMYTLFTINVILTEKGRQELRQVLNTVFSYLKMLQTVGPSKTVFDELQALSEISFRYDEEAPAVDLVEDLSVNMLHYPPCHYLTGPELFFEYGPQDITKFLSRMTPNKCNIMVSSKKPTPNVTLDKKEEWFGTKYTNVKIPQEWIDEWNNIEPYPVFHLPEANVFITTDFDLVKEPSITKYPEKITNTDLIQLWYRADDKFRLPLASINLHVMNPKVTESAVFAVHLSLVLRIMSHLLIEELYPASTALLEYRIQVTDYGFELIVYGFNQKLPLVIEKFIDGFTNFGDKLTETLFTELKEMHAKSYYNETLKPSAVARDIRLSLILNRHFSLSEKYSKVFDVTIDSVKEFVKSLFDGVRVQALVQGNITRPEAEEVVKTFVEKLNCVPFQGGDFEPYIVTDVPPGVKCCRVLSQNVINRTCVTTVYIQKGPGTIKDHATIELLITLMEEPMFDMLRTQEQLGYDVGCDVRESYGILGCTLTVHSQIDKFKVDHVHSRIEAFITHFREQLKKQSLEDFLEAQQSLIKIKLCADTQLKDEVKRNWVEIKCLEYVFDRLSKQVGYISELTQAEMIDFYHQLVHNTQGKRLVVQVVAAEEGPPEGQDHSSLPQNIKSEVVVDPNITKDDFFIKSIDEWKSTATYNPPCKLIK